MKAQLFIAVMTAFSSPAIPILHAGERLHLESSIYVFKQSAFHEINIPDATESANGQTLVFKSPVTARFDQLTLSLEDSRVAWDGGSSAPEQFSLVATLPAVVAALNTPVTITSSAGIQYLERTADNGLQVREIRSDSPEAPHVLLSFTASKGGDSAGDLLLACDLDIATVYVREKIPGLALEVGKPKIATFKEKEMIHVRSGQRAAILVKGPNGSDYSMLLLLRLTYAEARNAAPSNGGRSTDSAGVHAGAATPERSVGPGVGNTIRADAPKPAPRIEVIFDHPENYVDRRLSFGEDWYRDAYFSKVRNFLVTLTDPMLPEGYHLMITFRNIDLAYRRGGGGGYASYPYNSNAPAFAFTYLVTDASGTAVRRGTEHLRNNWDFAPLTTEGTDTLRFEKAMLKEWAGIKLADLKKR